MLRDRGFIQLSMMGWAAVAAAAAIALLSGALWIQTSRLDTAIRQFAEYRGGVEALGRAAEITTARINLANLNKKERQDEEAARVAARHTATVQRLRNEIASRGVLPGPRSEAKDPSRITFDRAELDRALRDFAQGAAGIAADGGEAVEKLDVLKRE